MLVDAKGRTLYYCTCDTSVIECTTPNSGCPSVWSRLLVTGKPTAGAGVNPKLLGTVDGTQPRSLQDHPPNTLRSPVPGRGRIVGTGVLRPLVRAGTERQVDQETDPAHALKKH